MKARRLLPWILALVCPGCLDSLLEAPYVLTPGLGVARSVAPTDLGTMLVAGDKGLFEVSGDGDPTHLREGPVLAVGSHPGLLYLLSPDTFEVAPRDTMSWTTVPAPGAIDLQAWCDHTVVVATTDALLLWRPGATSLEPWVEGLGNLRGLALDLDAVCERLLVVTDHQVLRIEGTSTTVLVDRLVEARAVAMDGQHDLWVVHGTPPVLSRREADGRLETIARHLGDTRDLQFGTGGLFASLNVYLADGGGTLDYLRAPERSRP